jgi:hypothetical protein
VSHDFVTERDFRSFYTIFRLHESRGRAASPLSRNFDFPVSIFIFLLKRSGFALDGKDQNRYVSGRGVLCAPILCCFSLIGYVETVPVHIFDGCCPVGSLFVRRRMFRLAKARLV